MVSFLSNYIVPEQELSNVKTEIRSKFEELLSSEDRLHCFMTLYEVASAALELLDEVDKTDFLSKIVTDLDALHTKHDILLHQKTLDVKTRFESIQIQAEEGEKELSARSECIQQVIEGMGNPEELDIMIKGIREQLSEIDKRIVQLGKLRQSTPFVDMCKMLDNEH